MAKKPFLHTLRFLTKEIKQRQTLLKTFKEVRKLPTGKKGSPLSSFAGAKKLSFGQEIQSALLGRATPTSLVGNVGRPGKKALNKLKKERKKAGQIVFKRLRGRVIPIRRK